MSFPDDAQRASDHPRRWRRIGAITLAAMLCAGSVALTDPLPGAAATSTRVAIIVGPAGSQTTANRAWADAAAREALKYTANVVKVYTPNATWAKVKAAMTGASVVVYVGRGSGFPSVSSSVLKPATHNGFGLNPVAGRGSSTTRYYGETYIRTVKLAPKAVVLLHRTDYASGWSPSGYAQPSLSVARRRVDNYGAGFLAAGASAVIAEYSTSPAYYVRAIFTQSTSLASVWNGAAAYHGHVTSFTSTRTRSATGRTDPVSSGSGYTRSIVGWPSTRTTSVRTVVSPPTAPPTPTPTPRSTATPPSASLVTPTPTPTPRSTATPPSASPVTPTPTPGAPGCGSSLQAKVDAAPSGGTLDLTGCTYVAGATIGKPLTIVGARVNVPADQRGFIVTASNVTLDRLVITGAQATSYSWNEVGVLTTGSVSGLVVRDSTIRTFGNAGIWVGSSTNSRITGTTIEDAVYAGIMIISAAGGRVDGNVVRRVGVQGASANGNNAYGIALENEGGAVSTDVVVDGNTVADVPTWHGLDTHAGVRISFTNNTVSGAPRALFITSDGSGRKATDITVTGNRFLSPAPATTNLVTVTTYQAVNVSVTGNSASGWGDASFFYDYQGRSTGLVVSGNVISP